MLVKFLVKICWSQSVWPAIGRLHPGCCTNSAAKSKSSWNNKIADGHIAQSHRSFPPPLLPEQTNNQIGVKLQLVLSTTPGRILLQSIACPSRTKGPSHWSSSPWLRPNEKEKPSETALSGQWVEQATENRKDLECTRKTHCFRGVRNFIKDNSVPFCFRGAGRLCNKNGILSSRMHLFSGMLRYPSYRLQIFLWTSVPPVL